MPKLAKSRLRRTADMLNPSRLWRGRSVRTQLLVVLAAVNLLAAAAAGTVWIMNTRSATRAEIESSLRIAEALASAKLRELASLGRQAGLSEHYPKNSRA